MSKINVPKLKTPNVFAVVEYGAYRNRKKVKCALTGKPIVTDDLVYMVKRNSYNDAERFYVSDEAAQSDLAFLDSVNNLRKCSYPVQLMFYDNDASYGRMCKFELDPDWFEEQKFLRIMNMFDGDYDLNEKIERTARYLNLSINEAQETFLRLQTSRRSQRSIDSLWDKAWIILSNMTERFADSSCNNHSWELLGSLAMCELHHRMVEQFESLAIELQVILACSDNPVFLQLAMNKLLLPEWSTVMQLVSKHRLSLDDMLELAAWGDKYPEALKLLYQVNRKAGILYFSTSGPIGFSVLENGRWAYLLMLFTSRPDICPILSRFDPEKPYFDEEEWREISDNSNVSWSYQMPYLYRAKALESLLAGKATYARHVVDCMCKHVHFYIHGSPAGYIKETARLVELYIKRYPVTS